ncbi:MAG TPA: hypothetical protein VF530_18490 [Planctomycetota bacterium]
MRSALAPYVRALLAASALLAACSSSDDDDDSFVIRTTTQAAEPSAMPVVVGNWMVYFAREAFSGPAGTDLNGDGQINDQVAFVVNMAGPTETNLAVAAQGAVIAGSEIYLVVLEADDGRQWNALGTDDRVLLHWSAAAGTVTFVDTLWPDQDPIAVGSRIFYASATGPLLAEETNLRMISSSSPTTPVPVMTEVGATLLTARLLGARSGLVFAAIDETNDSDDRNGDGDGLDPFVLALLDGTVDGARLVNAGLALADADEPLAARSLGTSDWLVAFLVDEAAQGVSLNDQNLLDGMGGPVFTQPILPSLGCANDVDTLDRVLHYLDYSDLVAGTVGPVNTGIVGQDRVLVGNGFVATQSDEADSNCNLNDDADAGTGADVILRWVETVLPNAPVVDTALLHALATGTAGGSMGFALLDNRIVAVVDEAADDADFDTQAGEASADHDLIGWIEPTAATPTWRFSHQGANQAIGTGVFDSTGKSEPFAGTTWLAPEPVGDRLPLVFLEEVPSMANPNLGSLNTNLDCALVVKDNDEADGLPVWADFESGPILDFDGMGYAVHKTNAGIEIAAGFAWFRVSEADDNRDYNGDGQANDVVLFRNPLASCSPAAFGTASLVSGPVLITDRVAGGAFFSDEALAGVDFNDDGDTGDVVVRYFRF